MERFTPAGALPVYVGDDEMDEEAFSEIKKRGGLALRVTAKLVHSRSDARLASYHEVRTWLNELVDLPEEIRS
jgi:trehalose-6-phosphatase